MKTSRLILAALMLIASICVFSCNEEVISEPQIPPTIEKEKDEKTFLTTEILHDRVARTLLPGDPNLVPSWKWYEDSPQQIYYINNGQIQQYPGVI